MSEPIDNSRILVIDDEEIIHTSLRRMLRRQGHHVDAVLSAREGLEHLYAEDYDLVITDLMMPEMNGIQLLEKLKQDAIRVPVLMITGYPTISTAVKALRLGAVDYLAKPFTRQELIGPVNRALRRAANGRAVVTMTGEFTVLSEGLAMPEVDVQPGDTFYLREHSWACYGQDGSMEVGVETSFLSTVGDVSSLECPRDGDLVEQGYGSIKLTTREGEIHSVFTPISGQVMQVNEVLLAHPEAIHSGTWVMRVLPSRLEAELDLLKKRRT